MLDSTDYGAAHYLDELAASYAEQGFAVYMLPFYYGADFGTIAAGASAERQVTVEHDSDFAFCQQTAFVTSAGTPAARPEIDVSLVVDTSQRALQAAPVNVYNSYGTGPRPAYLFKPFVLPAKSTFTVTVANVSAATPFDVKLTYGGAKVYLAERAA